MHIQTDRIRLGFSNVGLARKVHVVDSQQPEEYDHILVVTGDTETRDVLVMTLENAGSYHVSLAASFEDALDRLITQKFALALVDVKLPDLSGIDLVTAASALCTNVPVILIDDTLSAKSAVAAFRLGALDYVSKPVNLDFILMRIDLQLREMRKAEAQQKARALSQNGEKANALPKSRSTALSVSQMQFTRINKELNDLYLRIEAQFIGLVDTDNNLVGTAGRLDSCDLLLLTRALGVNQGPTNPLINILGESHFYTTYLEGSNNGVYIIEFGQQQRVSLLVICPIEAKRGVVWLYSKRAAQAIDIILNQHDSTSASPAAGTITPTASTS